MIRHTRWGVLGLVLLSSALGVVVPATAQVHLKVATWARTISAGVGAPFAVATKLGWFRQEGVEVEVVPLPGSTDCVKNIATKAVDFALASVEPLAIGRPQGVREKVLYTAYQGNIYGIAVPADSPIKSVAELRGKTIGVTNMASAGVVVARAMVSAHGMDPDRDVKIVVAGEGAQPAAMLRGKQVDALSQFDTQYALVENAGIKMRMLEAAEIARFPSNGFIALEDTIKGRRREAIALGRGYAKGTIFAMNNPEAAVRIVYEVFPQTVPTGKDEATAVREDVNVLKARIENVRLERGGVTRWGENSEANYGAYAKFMLKWGIIKTPVEATELVTNELIDEINRFDAKQIAAEAKAYRHR